MCWAELSDTAGCSRVYNKLYFPTRTERSPGPFRKVICQGVGMMAEPKSPADVPSGQLSAERKRPPIVRWLASAAEFLWGYFWKDECQTRIHGGICTLLPSQVIRIFCKGLHYCLISDSDAYIFCAALHNPCMRDTSGNKRGKSLCKMAATKNACKP